MTGYVRTRNTGKYSKLALPVASRELRHDVMPRWVQSRVIMSAKIRFKELALSREERDSWPQRRAKRYIDAQ